MIKKIKLSELNINKEKFTKAFFVFSIFAFILSLSAQVFLTNKFATKGSEMTDLIERREDLETELSLLKIKSSEISSLKEIEKRAKDLGFVEYSSSIAVIDSSQFAAIR